MRKKLLIEALSTNSGGAISHLKNLLENVDKQNYFKKIDVYLPSTTKKLMPKRKKINYISPNFFTRTLFLRIIWQTLFLNIITFKNKYDCIFVTGSSHLLFTKPVVTISQNLLPFSKDEIKKYFFSYFYLKLIILRFIQKLSFRMSEGIIFLHKYSKKKILAQIGNITGLINIVPHGIEINKRRNIKKENKFRLIYVSNIDLYKNQVFLVGAIDNFINKNHYFKDKIKVEFYGSHYKPALKTLSKSINSLKKNKYIFKYMGLKNRDAIYTNKKGYNTIFLFSSSCENFSVTLIEGMSKGLPILCVNLEPMRSVLGNNAIFYKHNSVKSFQKGLFHILSSFKKRKILSKSVYNKSKQYNGAIVAKKTFSFLRKVSEKNYER
tara:strand:- start:879 stop:2018 length:1140 start_codon:yes stop_codon:yes gene_type:complete